MNRIDQICINTIRTLSMDAVQKANSGHPGTPMALAPIGYLLFTRHMKHNPKNPKWYNRDRFILSCGHASMLLYSLLHLTGYDVSLDDLKAFRQWGSKTAGHPEYGEIPGIETTTGPLGQGCGNSVGMAICETHLAAHFNKGGHKIVDHTTFVLCSDGDLMEGVSQEAASIAGHLKLGKLIWIYDNNQITIEGSTSLAFSENVTERFKSYGWHTQEVGDANDLDAVNKAIETAKAEKNQPSFISVKSCIGYGAPNKQSTASAHGEPLGQEEIRGAKRFYGWPEDKDFYVPEEAIDHFRKAIDKGIKEERTWEENRKKWAEELPQLAGEWERVQRGELPRDWDRDVPCFPPDSKGLATRASSGQVLNAIAEHVPELIGGSADLAPSTKTLIKNGGDFEKDRYDKRNLHFGVREHAMGAILNGMALHGGVIPFGATFFIFSDYMRPAIRLAALMELKIIFVFTHDSITLGEDGPTHQPVEQLMSLRAVPGLTVIRPAEANETAQAWQIAVESKGPVALVLTRQNVPTLDTEKYPIKNGVEKGAYILSGSKGKNPDLILIASGSEVHLALSAQKALSEKGIDTRVVSMPSWELFDSRPKAYQDEVLPPQTPKISIEAGISRGWRDYVGDSGRIIGLDRFGASAPGPIVYEKLGFNLNNILETATSLIKAQT